MARGRTSQAQMRAVRAAVRDFQRATAGRGDAAPVRMRFNDDDGASTTGFDRIFVGLGATMGNLVTVLGDPAVVATIRDAFARNFAEERGRTAWPGLAPLTQAERRRLGYGANGPILVRTGGLRQHVMTAPPRVSRDARGVVLRIAPGPTVNGVRKYRALAKGSPSRNLPARPMVVITPQSGTRITSAISRTLRTRAAANGLR